VPIYKFDFINRVRVRVSDSKVRIGIFQTMVNLWNGTNHFAKSVYYDHITINIKTGYTYSFGRINLNKKKISKSIHNISYNPPRWLDIPKEALNHLYTLIRNEMRNVHGENVPDYKSYPIELNLPSLIWYVRNPYINPKVFSTIIHVCKSMINVNNRYYLNKFYVKNDCSDPIMQMFSNSKLPYVKSFKNIVFSRPMGLPVLFSITRTFKNKDLIRSLYISYEKYCNKVGWKSNIHIDFSGSIYKTLVKYKNERIIAAKLINFINNDHENNVFFTLRDMSRFYDRLISCDFDFSKKYSINELHDYLADTVTKQNCENEMISYTPDELALTTSDSTFSLVLPKDTHELINVGSEMKICVGSYADEVVYKMCTIYVVKQNDLGTPVGCIEMSGSAVKQAKGKNNKLLQNQVKDFVAKWVIEKELLIATDDLRGIA